jgi:hypothetical protein
MNSKGDKLQDIAQLNNANLTDVAIRKRLITANSEFTTMLNTFDKDALKSNNNISENPFDREFKGNLEKTVKPEFDRLAKTVYKDLPEFIKLRKIINVGYLLTRIYHYKRISTVKSELNIIQEDLNQSEFIFYDKMVEGFREFYYPSRQYLNREINDIFMTNDEVDIFELRQKFTSDNIDTDPEGIDQINFSSKTSSDPKYEISLALEFSHDLIAS